MPDEKGEPPILDLTDVVSPSVDLRTKLKTDMMQQAQVMATQKVITADSLARFLQYHAAAVSCTDSVMGWLFDMEATTPKKPEDILSFFEDKQIVQVMQREAALVWDMKQFIDQTPEAENMIRMVLARFREKPKSPYQYVALAAFPKGKGIGDDVLRVNILQDPDSRDVLFYKPSYNGCYQHACEVLFLQNRINDPKKARAVLRVPFLSWDDIYKFSRMNVNDRGVTEFLLRQNTDGTKETLDALRYVMTGIYGLSSTELDRVRVSDFWNRHPPQASPTGAR